MAIFFKLMQDLLGYLFNHFSDCLYKCGGHAEALVSLSLGIGKGMNVEREREREREVDDF